MSGTLRPERSFLEGATHLSPNLVTPSAKSLCSSIFFRRTSPVSRLTSLTDDCPFMPAVMTSPQAERWCSCRIAIALLHVRVCDCHADV